MKSILTALLWGFGMCLALIAIIIFDQGEAIRSHINLPFVAQITGCASLVMIIAGLYLLPQKGIEPGERE